MRSLVLHRADRSRKLLWAQIGAVAGPNIVPSEILRAANLQILGSGQGSVATTDIITELSALAVEITRGTFLVDAVAAPLAEIETAWNATVPSGQRVVVTP
jgi:hypothetical protein